MQPSPQAGSGPRVDPIEILLKASEVAADHTLDLDDLLRALAALVRKVVPFQLFAIMLSDEDETLAIRYSIGYRPELVRNLRLVLGQGITGAAAQSRKTVLVNDVSKDPRYVAAVDAVRSEIAVPLVAHGKLVGVIDLQTSRLNAFSDVERNLLELIASRFSLAIVAAQLYRASTEQNVTLRTLSLIAQEFSQILQLKQLLEQISSLVRGLIRYDAFSIYLLDEEAEQLVHYFGVRFDERVQWSSMPLGEGIVGTAAQTRQPVLVRDTTKDSRYVEAVEGIRSEVAVPLMHQGNVIGVLDLECEQEGKFTEEHVRTLSLLAPQIAISIENARLYEEVAEARKRLERDLHAARRLQQSLLPDGAPRFEGIEVAAHNTPALEVSGDFFDFYPEPGRAFGIMNGDVSGKGAAAALFAAMASGALRNLTSAELDPSEVLDLVNSTLLERGVDAHYLAAIFAQWRPAERKLVVASAGQPPPIVRLRGRAEALDIGGMPLGIFPKGAHDRVELELAPGDVFLTASDGLHEALGLSGEDYPNERLLRLIESLPDADAGEILQAVLSDVDEFSGGRSPADDRTVVVVKAI